MGERDVAWKDATKRLLEDPAFGPLVKQVGPVRLREPRGGAFASLASAIVYQQLAGAAARTIHGRFVEALGGTVTPAAVLEASDEALRSAGLSRNKMAAIRDLASKSEAGDVAVDELPDMTDHEVVEALTLVRGIGSWTAHMYLIFDLRRPDVWPTGDLGVRQGLGRVFRLPEPPTPKQMEFIGFGYRPWRSAVAWYCWRAMETLTPGD